MEVYVRRGAGALRTGLVVVAAIVAVLVFADTARSQAVLQGQGEEVRRCDDALRAEIIDSIALALNEYYVFPEMAKEMEKTMRKNLKQGKYKDLSTVPEFTFALTEDLRGVCHDRHLGIRYLSDEDLAQMTSDEPTDEQKAQRLEEMRKRLAKQNFMYKKIEILEGNVGYLKFNQFVDASMAGPTAVAAMNFLAGCDALIIDLRDNGGGSPSLIQLITSYFFDEPVHLNSFYIRRTDSIKQFWTAASVDGPRLSHVDIYVLTSNRTFSGAEEFSYNLKNLKRATLIGETTGGGAHPVESHFFASLNVGAGIPFGRAINPITGTNWEGTGVAPDIEVPAAQALDRAYIEALGKLKERATDPEIKLRYDWVIAGLEAAYKPVVIDSEKLASYAGVYEDRRLWVEGGALWYQRGDRPKMKAVPMTETLFRFDDVDYFRIEIVTDVTGNPVKVVGHYDNGQTDESMRTAEG
ncbi:MAG: S41 family peptidase [candidate division Zixibacteria bacterium]|jgi:hypothetical protein|nr:S41 family peptidase [candidate division Zixibacteria bacterium]